MIEKNIPIPTISTPGRPPSVFALTVWDMDIGDSIECSKLGVKLLTCRANVAKVAKATGRKFSWRGTRVWRTV